MYQPTAFRETDTSVLFAAMRQHPLATLVTHGSLGLMADEIPCLLDVLDVMDVQQAPGDTSNKGSTDNMQPQAILRAHLARANPQIEALAQAEAQGRECLLIFRGPQAYVSPNWYATKAETHKVVPTWNYVVIQAWGIPRVMDDRDWLRAQVEALSREHEATQPQPWQVSDAPAPYIDAMCRAIVGVEIPITRLDGKFKISQNRPKNDQSGVVAGLLAQTPPQKEMARLVAGLTAKQP